MRWSSITGRGFANRAYRVEGSSRAPARSGTPPLRAAVFTFLVALFPTGGLPSAPVEEIFGVWVLDRASDSMNGDDTRRAKGDLAIWQTDAAIGLTWSRLPPDPVRRTFEFARSPADGRLEFVRSDPPLVSGERLEAQLEPDRFVVGIVRAGGEVERQARYAFFINEGRLVVYYRLLQGSLLIDSATRQLRRLKVVM